jgi:aspartate/methionine/tyrosine aminotransferase
MLPIFELEQYLLENEHKSSLSLCSSGLESMGISELLAKADPDTLALFNNLTLDYSLPQGATLLRQEIAKQYSTISPEDICVFAGAAEGILCTLQGFLTPHDHAVIVTPCYQSLYSIPASQCETTLVSLDETNKWQLNLDRIQEALRHNTKVIVINFPNNPTGALPDKGTIDGLIKMARKRGIYIFSDEVYRLMEIDPVNRLPAIADWYEKGISISSMSKAYGLPGLRIGWVVSKAPEVISFAIGQKHYTSICPNTAAEVLAMVALRAGKAILERNLQIMNSNLVLMEQFFERAWDKCAWIKPRGGCLGFPCLLTSETAERLSYRLLEKEGVMILPGILYGKYASHFRIGFGKRDMREALAKFENILNESSFSLA